MSITIFANQHVPASNETVQKFVSAGVAFGVRSPQRDMTSIRTARITAYPTVCAVTSAGHVRWEGHQPKLIELLIDLLDTGPVPTHGLDNIEAAQDVVLTRQQVIEVIARHQVSDKEFFVDCGDFPLYRGKEVLDWLDY